MKQYVVSEKTFGFLKGLGDSDYFHIYDKWLGTDMQLNRALDELNSFPDTGISKIFTELIKGEAELVKKSKKYHVILPNIEHVGNGEHWNIIFVKSSNSLGHTDFLHSVTTFTEEELKNLPQWAQDLAKEV